MPGLFEQFPHTNLHELNLDWIIDLINQFKQELEDSAVLSVNGQTGHVTLYESENVILPPLTNTSSWRLVRMMDGQYVGVLFQDGHVWLQQGNSTLKLLTTEDIPTSAGVVSINGQTGIVTLTGRDIAIDDSPDADSIRLALETEHTERVNADTALQNAITTLHSNAVSITTLINGRGTVTFQKIIDAVHIHVDVANIQDGNVIVEIPVEFQRGATNKAFPAVFKNHNTDPQCGLIFINGNQQLIYFGPTVDDNNSFSCESDFITW